MHVHDLPEHLFDWVSSIPYDALDAQQKEEVAAFLSPEEYMSIQQWLQTLNTVNVEMDSQMRALEGAPTKVNRLRAIWHYPIPLYQVAAILLLLIAGWNLMVGLPAADQESHPVDPRAVSIEQGFYPDSLVFEL
ncbi:MAG: hypothetical protein AAGH79_13040 [Bacteroidota bacterium]